MKFILFSFSTFFVAFLIICIYFYKYVKEDSYRKAKDEVSYIFDNISKDVKKYQKDIIEEAKLLDNDKSFLSSIYLINSYQHRDDYNSMLIDEEKKIIHDKLLDKTKSGEKDEVLLYLKDNKLAVGTKKINGKYISFFNTYIDGKEYFYNIDSSNLIEYNKFFIHNMLEKDKNSIDIRDNKLFLTIFHHIKNVDEIVGHIKLSKRLDIIKYYSNNKNSITLSYQDIDKSNNDKYYISSLKLDKVYIIIHHKKDNIFAILSYNNTNFLAVLLITSFAFVFILYLFYHFILISPLSILMNNIKSIKQREFDNIKILNSNDEFREISKSIENLSYNIKVKERELLYIARHDSLTKLYNRYYFNSILENKIKTLVDNSHLALIFIDIDEFKSINDILGHNIGDKLLVEVASRLYKFVRGKASLGRIGGDEFMIVISNILYQEQLDIFVQELHHIFKEHFVINDKYIKVTISSGVVISYDKNITVDRLYKEADIALYKSKERGKNQFTIYQTQFEEELRAKENILDYLKNAMDTFGDFHLVYQPKIKTSDAKTVAGVEVLIRCNSHKLGLLSPETFIPIAEESGLIIPLGYWIITKALDDFILLKNKNIDIKQISINLSSIQIESSNFLDKIKTIIAQSKIDPSCIEFELTERVIADDNSKTLEILNAIRDMGIDIAIDDFGTGYSSLSYLQKFPISRLKIDKAFVTNVDTNNSLNIIEKSIIPLAQVLNINTTAEGVERKEEFEVLKRVGVDDIQGFYFSKPMRIDKLEQYMKKDK